MSETFAEFYVGIAHLELPEYTPFLSKFLSSSHFYFIWKNCMTPLGIDLEFY